MRSIYELQDNFVEKQLIALKAGKKKLVLKRVLEKNKYDDFMYGISESIKSNNIGAAIKKMGKYITKFGNVFYYCSGGFCGEETEYDIKNNTLLMFKNGSLVEKFNTKGAKISFYVCDWCRECGVEIERLCEKDD